MIYSYKIKDSTFPEIVSLRERYRNKPHGKSFSHVITDALQIYLKRDESDSLIEILAAQREILAILKGRASVVQPKQRDADLSAL